MLPLGAGLHLISPASHWTQLRNYLHLARSAPQILSSMVAEERFPPMEMWPMPTFHGSPTPSHQIRRGRSPRTLASLTQNRLLQVPRLHTNQHQNLRVSGPLKLQKAATSSLHTHSPLLAKDLIGLLPNHSIFRVRQGLVSCKDMTLVILDYYSNQIAAQYLKSSLRLK